VKLYFKEPDYYIHGTNEVESLGAAASHGCLRMSPEDVADRARHVMEAGGANNSDDWDNSAMYDGQTRTVVLPHAISLIVGEWRCHSEPSLSFRAFLVIPSLPCHSERSEESARRPRLT